RPGGPAGAAPAPAPRRPAGRLRPAAPAPGGMAARPADPAPARAHVPGAVPHEGPAGDQPRHLRRPAPRGVGKLPGVLRPGAHRVLRLPGPDAAPARPAA